MLSTGLMSFPQSHPKVASEKLSACISVHLRQKNDEVTREQLQKKGSPA